MDIDRIDIAELDSPHRVSKIAGEYALTKCEALDFKTGWDFSKMSVRRKAWDKIQKEKPMLVIGSPPCTMFSTLQHMNTTKSAGHREEEWEEAVRHMFFASKSTGTNYDKDGISFMNIRQLRDRGDYRQ